MVRQVRWTGRCWGVDGLRAGVGRRSVDPPLGIRTAGFSSREHVVEGIDEELSATTLVLEGLGRRVCIAAIDLCMVPQDIAMAWRSAIADAIGTEPSHVLINLSHTHSAGALLRTQPEFVDQADLLGAYQAMLEVRLVEAARAAVASLRPARIGAGSGESRIGVQRRERDADGYVVLGESPTDPSIPWSVSSGWTTWMVDPSRSSPRMAATTVAVGPRSRRGVAGLPGAHAAHGRGRPSVARACSSREAGATSCRSGA